jgi:predicted RNA-binding protein YlxR (DUF448 family)
LRIVACEPSPAGGRARAKRLNTHALADPRAVMPGRGAYLCREAGSASPAEECLQRAMGRGAIARALRRSIPGGLVLDDAELVESGGR